MRGDKMDFNIEAANWDNERRVKRAKIISDEILKSIQIKEHCRALEFGCGTGLVSFNLADVFEHITLIDNSEGMINAVNVKMKALRINNMTAVQEDINDSTGIPGYRADVIYTSMALHHIVDIRTTLKNLYGMLNDKGYLCIVELTEDDGNFHRLEKDFRGHNGFNRYELSQMLEKLGFKDVNSNVFFNGSRVIEDSEISYSLFLMTGRK
jgi:ubiquinone/menaquinone biosynthesis C-methylase UbiE